MVLIQNIGVVPEKPIDPEGDIRRVSYSAYQLWRFLFGDMWDNRKEREIWDMGPIGLIWPAKAPKEEEKPKEDVTQKEGPATAGDLKKTAPYFPSRPGYLRGSQRPLITTQGREGPTPDNINVPPRGEIPPIRRFRGFPPEESEPYGGRRMTELDHDHDDRYSKLGHEHPEYVSRDGLGNFLNIFTEDQLDKITDQGDNQVKRVEDQGNTQVDRVIKEGDSQIEKVADKGDSVIELIQKMEEDGINQLGDFNRKLIDDMEKTGNEQIEGIRYHGDEQKKGIENSGKDYIDQLTQYVENAKESILAASNEAMGKLTRASTPESESIRAAFRDYQSFRAVSERIESDIRDYDNQKRGLDARLTRLKVNAERTDKDYGKLDMLEKYGENPSGEEMTKALIRFRENLPQMAKGYERAIEGLKEVAKEAENRAGRLKALKESAENNIEEARKEIEYLDSEAANYRSFIDTQTEENEATIEMRYIMNDLPEKEQNDVIDRLAGTEAQSIKRFEFFEIGYKTASKLFSTSYSKNEEYTTSADNLKQELMGIKKEANSLITTHQEKLDRIQNYINKTS